MFADAEAYERYMGRWSRLVAGPFLDFTEVLNLGKILDVGSGTGALTVAVAERNLNVQVLGIDPSKEYVAYATSGNPFPERVEFETGDAQKLEFADASFEACLSLLVFNFIPDSVKAIKELRRVTKPGGRISAAVWDYGEGMQMLRTFWDAAAKIDPKAEKLDERHMPLCRPGELTALWRQAGLEGVREKPQTVTTRFESFLDYWEPFRLGQGPAGAYVKSLDPDRLRALREEVKKRVSPSAEDLPIILSARVWSVRGTVAG